MVSPGLAEQFGGVWLADWVHHAPTGVAVSFFEEKHLCGTFAGQEVERGSRLCRQLLQFV